MPVGTRGTVKAVDVEDLRRLEVEVLLGNAYHLWRAPGPEAVAAAGGLHAWMGWKGNILTDSGGFQAVSLARAGEATVDDDGIDFATQTEPRRLTPELAIEVQERLAPDVMMALDHPWTSRPRLPRPAPPPSAPTAGRSAARPPGAGAPPSSSASSRAASTPTSGATVRAPSARSASLATASAASAWASRRTLSHQLTLAVNAVLEPDKPRYLMGVGSEPEMLAAIGAGVDMFDCVWPTRLARTGAALVGAGRINLRRAAFAGDERPLETGCACPACARHTRAQVRYLFLRGELLGYRLLTIHNLHHTLELMRRARAAILDGGYADFVAARLAPGPPRLIAPDRRSI